MPEERYIVGGRDGWLNVKREPSGDIIALPEFVRVRLESTVAGRDHFTALEGVERNRKFSVKNGNLSPNKPAYGAPANLRFSLTDELITYPGGRINAITHAGNPVPVGTHPIQIPDFPHALGGGYLSRSAYAKSWFYLGHGNAVVGRNDRYLHTGTLSAGCITVDPDSWTKLYQYLILCRRGDGKTVGTVTVIA